MVSSESTYIYWSFDYLLYPMLSPLEIASKVDSLALYCLSALFPVFDSARKLYLLSRMLERGSALSRSALPSTFDAAASCILTMYT